MNLVKRLVFTAFFISCGQLAASLTEAELAAVTLGTTLRDQQIAGQLLVNAREFLIAAQKDGWSDEEIDATLKTCLEVLTRKQENQQYNETLDLRARVLEHEISTMRIMKIFSGVTAVAGVLVSLYLLLAVMH